MSENAKQTDPDIVEMDFPPYVEEHSPFPDVEPEFNFEDNKEEIYLRNRIIAAEEQVKLLKEEERKRLEKQEQFREMTEAAKSADKKRHWDNIILLDSIIVIFGIIALIVALSGRTSNPPVSVYDSFEKIQTDSIWDEMRLAETAAAVPKTETEAVTQVSREPVVTKSSKKKKEKEEKEETQIILDKDPFSAYDERNEEMLKTTAVREPFEAAEGETVANSSVMSYKIKNVHSYSKSKEREYHTIPGSVSVTADITIKNLTDYDYAVKMSQFYLYCLPSRGSRGIFLDEKFSGYDESLAEYNDDGELDWLHFDENNLCSFTVTVSDCDFTNRLVVGYYYDKTSKYPSNFKYVIDREGIYEGIDIPYESRTVVIVE